jgi:pimeloyl-ACP methyl ester carboxylesterase
LADTTTPRFQPLRVGNEGAVVTGAEAGAGAPLVLLHGLGGTWEYWGKAMALLAGRARCVALDLPGFGHSDPPVGEFTLDSAADRLADVLRALRLGPTAICGHSLGGPLAVRLALRHPDLASRLILVGPSGLKPAPPWQDRIVKLVPAYTFIRRAPFPWEHWLLRITPLRHAALRSLVDNPSTVDDETARNLVDGGRAARSLREAIDDSFATGLGEEAARAAVPVAAIWGDRDRMVPPADSAVLREAVPSADIRFLRGCGHLPMVERPEAFSLLLAELAAL